MSVPPRPSFIVSTADVPEEAPGQYPHSDEPLSSGRPLGSAAGLQRMGVHIERLPPGRRTSWPHAEGDEEEFVYVVEGEADVWVDGHLHHVKAGDFVGFVAGTGISHTVINNGDKDALLFVCGEKSKPGNRIYYPFHPQRREQMPAGQWWENPPVQPMGPHDGTPDRPTQKVMPARTRPGKT